MKAMGWMAVALLAACQRTERSGAAGFVGQACAMEIPTIPEGGFQRTEVYLDVGGSSCPSELCVVNHYRGDLLLDPREGDGSAEQEEACGEDCGSSGIADRIYCTCKCGVSVDCVTAA